MTERDKRQRCAYCDTPLIGEPAYSIHRDGFGEGPEVPLCEQCGAHLSPTYEQIWEKTAQVPP